MTPAEADRFIISARRTLPSHFADAARAAGEARGEFLSAAAAIIGVLKEIAVDHPGKAAKITALISRYPL